MFHKVIFIIASAIIFIVLDQNWVFPPLFAHLPQLLSWPIAFGLAGFEIVALIAEWHYQDRGTIGTF